MYNFDAGGQGEDLSNIINKFLILAISFYS